MSLFGQQLMTAQYYCAACRTPFERVKGTDVLADARARLGQRKTAKEEARRKQSLES